MNLVTAKALILKGANEGLWKQRAADNDSITIGDKQFDQHEMLVALELLYREGYLVQVPSAGQAQTGINFRRADGHVETGKLPLTEGISEGG